MSELTVNILLLVVGDIEVNLETAPAVATEQRKSTFEGKMGVGVEKGRSPDTVIKDGVVM